MTSYKGIQHAGALLALLGGLSGTNCVAQPPGPPPPPPTEGSQTTVTGVVRNFSYGPGGLDGLILDRGTVIRFPPEYSERVASVAPIGSSVTASGWSRVARPETCFSTLTRLQILGAARRPHWLQVWCPLLPLRLLAVEEEGRPGRTTASTAA
jgi:hypothetical protein